MSAGGFKGFQQTGSSTTTVKANNMFAGFPSTDFGAVGNIGGIPSTGLVAWFKPDENITLNGSTVSQWQDTSGTYTLSQSTAANQPAYVQGDSTRNYRPYLSFNGSSTWINGGNILNIGTNQYFQIIALIQYTTLKNQLMIDSKATASLGRYLLGSSTITPFNNFRYSYQDSTSQKTVNSTGNNLDTNLHLQNFEIDRSGGNLYLSFDSNYRVSNTATNIETSNATGNNLNIGWSQGNNIFAQGYVFDIFFYNQLLSQADYLMLYNYIRTLYNF